mmetsp:Transcript_12974/g.15692  ORF Transcript_12974/g.15692 Transcript_12974/m.15692 type:complete len:116 (+) Transcript_12974:82-429(+)|eukprot:Skav218146  [mRNA]  locus=scaffold4089:8501:8848:- [translate_table: standard]
MAEQAIDDLEAQVQVQPVSEAPPVRDISWALTKSDRVQWCWYSIGWLFCVLFFPLGLFIWCTIACNHFCLPEEVRKNHPADEKVARVALMTFVTWCSILFLLLCLACGIFGATGY